MKSKLRAAFESVCEGCSPDRVVADQALNERFLAACREEGLVGSPATFNRALLNLRKQGDLRGLKCLPADTSTRVRKALEVELIRSRSPVFNVQR